MKICPQCKTEKPLMGFYKNSAQKDGLAIHCIACAKLRKYGYRTPRSLTSKVCPKCKIEKSLTDYHKNKRKWNGADIYCKTCTIEKSRLERKTLKGKEKTKLGWEKWRMNNPEKAAINKKKKPKAENQIYNAAKSRAKTKGIAFNLELNDIIIPSVCPILGIPIVRGNYKQMDTGPSLDRLFPEKGYVKGNVHVISRRANMIKNCGSAEEHYKIADWMKKAATT